MIDFGKMCPDQREFIPGFGHLIFVFFSLSLRLGNSYCIAISEVH